jgi:hypothetical protein
MSETSETVTVSIGRNVGDSPMSEGRWESFCDETLFTVDSLGDVYFLGTGGGNWGQEQEQSYTVVASIDVSRKRELVDSLAICARKFSQDAIAVTFGTTVFAGARETVS